VAKTSQRKKKQTELEHITTAQKSITSEYRYMRW